MGVNTHDQLQRLFRRIKLTLARGVIRLVADDPAIQRLQVSLLAGEVRSDLERLQQYGFSSVPLAGMDALVAFLGGERSNGVVIAVGDRQYRLKGDSGDVGIYDYRGQSVHLTATGIVVTGAGLPVTITDTPKVRLETARLEVTGDIIDQCDTQPLTLQGMRSTYNSHTHPGDSGGTTGAPNQGM